MAGKIDPAAMKCIAALQGAKNDTEKMAALFLVTKIVKASNLNRESRLALFNAIGFKFLLRLLVSPSTEDCPALLYKSVALSVLTAFCADPSIAESPEMLEAIPIFIQIVESMDENSEDDQLLVVINEAYHCLRSVALTEKGSLSLVKLGAIPKLVNLYSKLDVDEAVEVIRAVGVKLGTRTWENYPTGFNVLMDRISLQFEADQSEQKFELCGLMASILTTYNVNLENAEDSFWPSSILKGLIDILSSKITEKQRNPALKLASVTLTTLGVEWIIKTSDGDAKTYQFLVLLVHLSCIEVRMTLEDRTLDKIIPKDDLIGSCYGIIETTIRFMSGNHFEHLDEKQKEQVYTSLKGASSAILGFLNLVRKESEKNAKFWDSKKKVLTCASVRCLVAWLAEESGSLKEEVYKQLPFVLGIVFETFQDAELNQSMDSLALSEAGKSIEPLMPDVLCMLLPALCNLTSNENGVKILLEAHGEDLLNRFLTHNWSVYKNLKDLLEKKSRPKKVKKEKKGEPGDDLSTDDIKLALLKIRTALNNTCNLYINITVLDPDLVSSSPTFQQLMRWTFTALPLLNSPEDELYFHSNVASLGLLLLLDVTKGAVDSKAAGTLTAEQDLQSSRLLTGSDNAVFRFGQSVIRFVWDAHLPDESQSPASLEITTNYRAVWGDIKEMWFLCLQNIGALMEILPWLGDFAAESGFLEALISNLSIAYKNRIDASTLAAYEDFFCAALKGGEKSKKIIKTKGAALASSHHLRNLKKALAGEC